MKASEREYLINDDIDAYQATVKGLNIKQIKGLGISLIVAVCSFVLFMLLDVPMFLISIMTIATCLPVIIILFFNIEGLNFREFATRKWLYAFREPYCYRSQTLDEIERYIKEENEPARDDKKKKGVFCFSLLKKERKNKQNEDMDMKESRRERGKPYAEMPSGKEDSCFQEEDDIYSDSDEEYEEEIRELQEFMRNNVPDVEFIAGDENDEMIDESYDEPAGTRKNEEIHDTDDDYDEDDDSYRDVIGKNRIKLHLNEEEKHALFSANKAENSVREEIEEENHNAEVVEYGGDTEPLYFPSDSSGYELINMKNGMHIPLNKGETRIGRKKQFSDVTIENRSVSGKHAVITIREGTITVRDVGSRNGTYIDDAKIQSDFEIIVHENNKITFSNETFIIRKV